MARRAKAERRRFICYFGVGFVALFITSHLAIAQNDDAKLLDEIVAAPKLNLQRAEFRFQPPLAATSTEVLRTVSCVAVDRRGYVYVIQRGVPNPIIVADPAGRVVASWGEHLFKIPHTIRIDSEGNVWTVDAESSIVYKFTTQGRQLLQINVGGQPTVAPPRRNPTGAGPPLVGQFLGATDIAFGHNGQIYVSDGYANNRILEYQADGTKVREWGKKGTAAGEFDLPHAIAVAPNGDLYIADRESGRVQRFTPDGRYIGKWDYGGRLFSVVFGTQDDVYLTVRSKQLAGDAYGWLVRVDAKTGRVLGGIEDTCSPNFLHAGWIGIRRRQQWQFPGLQSSDVNSVTTPYKMAGLGHAIQFRKTFRLGCCRVHLDGIFGFVRDSGRNDAGAQATCYIGRATA